MASLPQSISKALSRLAPRNIYSENWNLKNENHFYKIAMAGMQKPLTDPMAGNTPIEQPNRRQMPYNWYYYMHDTSVVIRTCCLNIRNETFRRGGAWKPKFQKKCVNPGCEEEYDYEPEDNICEECKGALRDPDYSQREEADRFLFQMEYGFGHVNQASQTFVDVAKELEDDLNISDDAFMVFIKNYSTPEPVLVEIVRAHPQFIRIIFDSTGARGGLYYTCPVHRKEINRTQYEQGSGHCDVPGCGHELEDVHFTATNGTDEKRVALYLKGEVVHVSKYRPTSGYGTSPILTLYQLAQSLNAMEDWIFSAYSKKRAPAGILAIATKNMQGLHDWWDKEIQKLKLDRNYLPIIGMDPDAKAQAIQFVKLLDNLQEMEYIPVRDEIRQRISAMYGVSNIFMADTSTSGGLNNEGQQIVVTNRAVESAQSIHNQILIPAALEALGVTDWSWELLPSEEEDEMADLQRASLKIDNAKKMLDMGFDVKYVEGENEEIMFEFSGQASRPQNPFMPGGEQSPGLNAPERPAQEEANQQSGGNALNRSLDKSEEEGLRLEKLFWERATEAITQEDALFDRAYQGLTKQESRALNKMILEAFKEPQWDKTALIKSIIEKFKIDEGQADTIVRTEFQSVTNKSRELAYVDRMKETGETYYFKWVGPQDDRTTPTCTEIKQRIDAAGGKVELEVLKQLIKEVSQKNNPGLDYRDFVAHINCRHHLTRVVL